MLVVEYADSYGISMQEARKLTDEEKVVYNPEFQEHMIYGVVSGPREELPYITIKDFLKYRIGEWYKFPGCANQAYEITQKNWDTLLELNNKRKARAEEKKRLEDIKFYEGIVYKAEKQKDISSKEEAKRRMKQYNDLYNEGGEGYVPHIISREEYDRAVEKLNALKSIT